MWNHAVYTPFHIKPTPHKSWIDLLTHHNIIWRESIPIAVKKSASPVWTREYLVEAKEIERVHVGNFLPCEMYECIKQKNGCIGRKSINYLQHQTSHVDDEALFLALICTWSIYKSGWNSLCLLSCLFRLLESTNKKFWDYLQLLYTSSLLHLLLLLQ